MGSLLKAYKGSKMTMQQISKFFFSASNLVALGAVLIFNVVFLVFPFEPHWMFMIQIPVFYLAVFFLWPKRRQELTDYNEFSINPTLDRDGELKEIDAYLANLVNETAPKMPQTIAAQMRAVVEKISGVLSSPTLREDGMTTQFIGLKSIATRYLPNAVGYYVKIPLAMRSMRFTANRRTPAEILGEQLGILEGKLDEMLQAIAEEDVKKLIVHGKFLNEKFSDTSFGMEQK